jgi:hypothetical protein
MSDQHNIYSASNQFFLINVVALFKALRILNKFFPCLDVSCKNLTKRSSTRCHLKMFTKMKGLGVLIQKCFIHTRVLKYTQGQSPKTGIREYFYYIDHQGMVSLPKISKCTIL